MIKILNNRNTLLILSMVMGLSFSKGVEYLKPFTLYFLAVIMIFSATSFNFKLLKEFKIFAKTTLYSFFLNFILFGAVLLTTAYFLIDEKEIFWGFVIIAATPPGVAVIPFTFIYKGNLNYSLIGVLGVYLLSILATPLIISLFVKGADIEIFELIRVTIEVILIPILLSRLLLFKKIKPFVEKIRGKVVNWGFALIVYTVVGLNKQAIFNDTEMLLKISAVLIVAMFVLGVLYEFILRKKIRLKLRISQNLILTIKSSGFAASTALTVFGERSALPSAFLAVFVLLYLIFAEVIFPKKKKTTL